MGAGVGRHSLDQVLECVAVRPLLRERRSVSDGGEVTETEAVLHALLATRLLLLGALFTTTGMGETRCDK